MAWLGHRTVPKMVHPGVPHRENCSIRVVHDVARSHRVSTPLEVNLWHPIELVLYGWSTHGVPSWKSTLWVNLLYNDVIWIEWREWRSIHVYGVQTREWARELWVYTESLAQWVINQPKTSPFRTLYTQKHSSTFCFFWSFCFRISLLQSIPFQHYITYELY